jgi:dihydrofolate reductase
MCAAVLAPAVPAGVVAADTAESQQRKVVVFMSVSVDGYIAGSDGELDWHRVDEELHTHFNQVLGSMGAFLNGRVMYQLMSRFWPTADSGPASTPAMVEFAGIWRDVPKIVYSRSLDRAGWNAEIAREVVAEDVRALKAQPGGDLALGGADLAEVFRRHGLVDEYRLYVHPVLIGRGKPMFPTADDVTDLELVETHAFGNGVVLLRYAVAGEAGLT